MLWYEFVVTVSIFFILLSLAVLYTFSTCPIKGPRIQAWQIILVYGSIFLVVMGVMAALNPPST